ncbi:replication protein, partial [Bacillus thuringiensis]|nr:replication protein [Bacillus thuringiensis]
MSEVTMSSEDLQKMMDLTGLKVTDVMKLIQIKNDEEKEQREREEQQKNTDFVQLYRETMPAMRKLMVDNAFASSVLFFILEHMDNRNSLVCSH